MYKVKWTDEALENLSKIDEEIEKKIKREIEKHLINDPFWHGKPLKGRWEGFWRYRIDDYRAIYEIIYEVREKEIIIVVVKVGKRQEIYQGDLPCFTSDHRIIQRPKPKKLKK